MCEVPGGFQFHTVFAVLVAPTAFFLQVILIGERIDAATAHAWGVVQYLCETRPPLEKALEIAKKIAGHSQTAVQVRSLG